MRKFFNCVLSILVSMTMISSLQSPALLLAQEEETEEVQEEVEELVEDTKEEVSEEEVIEEETNEEETNEEEIEQENATTGEITDYDSLEKAAVAFRDILKDRNKTKGVRFPSSTSGFNESLFDSIVFQHTGNAYEGDALKSQFHCIEKSIIEENGYVTVGLNTYHAGTTKVQDLRVKTEIEDIIYENDLDEISAYDAIKKAYDIICDMTSLDTNHVSLCANDPEYHNSFNSEFDSKWTAHTAYAAVEQQKAVGEGIAALVYDMLLESGIDCRIVHGNMNGAHAWNIVYLNGNYYHLDASLDAANKKAGKPYEYFLKGSKAMVDRTISDSYIGGYAISTKDYIASQYGENDIVEQKTVGTISYTLLGKGLLTISGSGALTSNPIVNKTMVEKVVIEEGITSIPDSFFDGFKCVEEVVLPASVQSIGNNVFVSSPRYTVKPNSYALQYVKNNHYSYFIDCAHTLVAHAKVEPTCTEKGYEKYWTCKTCSQYFSDSMGKNIIPQPIHIDALGHNVVNWTILKEPTCTDLGEKRGSCTRCSVVQTLAMDKLAHTLIETKRVEPTCTKDGQREYWTCSVCSKMFSNKYATKEITSVVTIPKTGHTAVVDKRVEPTCTETGLSEGSHCSKCNEILIPQNSIDALGHLWDEGVEMDDGTILFTCKRNASHTRSELAPVSGEEVLQGYSLSLYGNIGIKFYLSLKNENAYVEFKLPNGTVQRVSVKDADVDSVSGKGYYVFTCFVSAKETTDPIQAQVHYDNGECGPVYTYTVEDYAKYLLANSNKYSAQAVNIAKNMMTYGRYAQEYFGYHTNALPSVVNPLEDINLDAYTYQLVDNNKDVDFVGARLILTTRPGLKLYFKGDASFKVNQEAAYCTKEGNYTVVTIYDIYNMKEMFNIDTDNFHLSYGIFSYGKQALQTLNTSLKNLIKAMDLYNRSISD